MENPENITKEPPRPPLSSPDEEIAFLRNETVREQVPPPPTPEQVSERVREYADTPSEKVLSDGYALKIDEIEEKVLHLSDEHEEAVDELVGVMQEHGIKNALEIAKQLDPHTRDDFHRFLVQYLVEFGSIDGLKEGTPLFKALRMKLFTVTLPKADENGTERSFSELVAGMEQFYAGMLSLGEVDASARRQAARYFTVEVAKSNYEDEVMFYCAVPREKERVFEKNLLAIFPDAHIEARNEDYNPFNPTGITLASVAREGGNPIFPIKTYDLFEVDPLNVILSSFSGIKHEGESAALQLVFSPVGDEYTERFTKALERIRKGESVEEATQSEGVRLAKEFGGALMETIFGTSSKKTKKDENEPSEDSEVEKDIEQKLEHPIVRVELRLVVSAATEVRAREILDGMASSFNQFEQPNGNGIVFKRIPDKKLSEFLHRFIYRIPDSDYGIPLNIKEVTTLLHFPVSASGVSNVREAKAKRAPAPASVSGDGILLGINKYRTDEVEVRFKREDRVRHFYVIGQTGTGKTTLLKNMIIQDIHNGDGVCMIDPHGSDIEEVLANIPKERIDDVIYFDPAYTPRPMGLNMLEYDMRYPEQKTFVVNELFSIFQKLYSGSPESMGPMFEQYFRNATMLVIEDPATGNTLLEVSRVLSDEKFRELKLSRCKNPIVVQFWREVATKAGGEAALANIVPYITSKFDVFMANEIMRPIIAQEKSAFNFRQIMDERKILLVNLSKGRLGDINASLIGLILVGKILMAALSRVDAPEDKRPDFYLYIDEFQNVTTDSISAILSEARKYRLSLNIAHQFIAQLEDGIRDSVFGNVGSIATYRVGSEDAEFLEKQFAPIFTAQDIMNIENFNAYVKLLINGLPAEPFSMAALPSPKGNPEIVPDIKELSYLKYGRPREEIENEIARKYAS